LDIRGILSKRIVRQKILKGKSGTLLIVLSMGYGLIKVPKLQYATRSIKIRKNWAYFVVAESEARKHKYMYNLEKHVFIIDKWEKDLQQEPSKYKEKEKLLFIRSRIDKELYKELVEKAKIDDAHKGQKLAKRVVNNKNLVVLHRQVKAKSFEYNNSVFTRGREMLNAIYFEELERAIEDGKSRIESNFNEYFERPWLFKKIPCLGISKSLTK
jgi:hypothetical protein